MFLFADPNTGAYFQTGWMMWNWMISALFLGAAIVCYDGSPFVPHENVLWDLVDKLGYVVGLRKLRYVVEHMITWTHGVTFDTFPYVTLRGDVGLDIIDFSKKHYDQCFHISVWKYSTWKCQYVQSNSFC